MVPNRGSRVRNPLEDQNANSRIHSSGERATLDRRPRSGRIR